MLGHDIIVQILTRILNDDMKSFITKRLNSILVNLKYLRFKLLKYKEIIRKFVILLNITSRIFLYI